MIIAHRGYAKQAQENTIESFDSALECGADAIETDIRITGDGFVVVSHDDKIYHNGTEIILSKSQRKKAEHLIGIDELFSYIKQSTVPFFLEIKTPSLELFNQIIKKISQNNLWDQVSLIGFSGCIKIALKAQEYYPKLMVDQIVMVPFLHFVKKPKPSRGIFFGWLDSIKYSEALFKTFISQNTILHLKQKYELLGYKVSCGVLNREDGIRYFQNAGIYDIFTDEVETAASILKPSFGKNIK